MCSNYEAGYKWSGGKLITVPGRRGRHLDITRSLQQLKERAPSIVTFGRFPLPTISLDPVVLDSGPFLDEALSFLGAGVRMRGLRSLQGRDARFQR